MKTPTTALLALVLATGASAQSFDEAADGSRTRLEEALTELAALREEMAAEKIPMSRELGELESELRTVRDEYQQTTRLLDSRTLDLSNLRTEIQAREDENTYLSGLLGEYIRNFESRLHIAEAQRYAGPLEAARLAAENSALDQEQVYEEQIGLLATSLDRLEDVLGGSRFGGTAVDPDGNVATGTFVVLGPTALFASDDGATVGTAEQRLGSLEPAALVFDDPALVADARAVVAEGRGAYPLDPSLGAAHKVAATEETFWEHVQKGGAVMWPIGIMAAAGLAVALFKWLSMAFVRKPSRKKVAALLEAVSAHDEEGAKRAAAEIKGPVGKVLTVGVEHLREPRELIEEVMYEVMLTVRLRLERMLPFIAICAASAPLLGLLGTVTGIINTFKLITVFGSGDVKSLSGGISEALITTECGLIVAIPSLLMHAFLSRKARGIVSSMETSSVAFVNEVSRSEFAADADAVVHPRPSRAPVPDECGRSGGEGARGDGVLPAADELLATS